MGILALGYLDYCCFVDFVGPEPVECSADSVGLGSVGYFEHIPRVMIIVHKKVSQS